MFPFEPTPVVQQETSELIPNSYVQSCSECCFATAPDGGPNVKGMLQKQMMTRVIDNDHGHLELLDCGRCPVSIAAQHRPAKTGDGRYIYWKGTDRRLSEDDLLKLEEDGDDITLFCDFRNG